MTGEHLEFIYQALHSEVITYAFKTFYAGGGLGEEGYRYKKKFLENLPLPKASTNFNNKNVECLICKLYGLTDEEISFITKMNATS